MSTACHQLVHTLSYGDAISGEVLALQRCLRELGLESEIFALNVHPKYTGMAHKADTFPMECAGEVILHYSLGSKLNDLYRSLVGVRRTLIYHNLTPARWFRGVNPRIVEDIERGVEELPELCALSDRIIADSRFNASEIRARGFEAQVLELPIDAEKWSVPRNEGIFSIVRSEPGIHVVHVGRLAPNKCIEDIIRTFYFVRRIEPRARLWLAGIDIDTELYSFALKRLVQHLELEGAVNFVGCLADSEVRALYEAGTVYLCMSEHEGFCLPVIEAMNFGLPVLAFSSSAVPDTVGRGGILFAEKRHPELAELIVEIHTSAELRGRLIAAGHERVRELSLDHFTNRVRELFGVAPVVSHLAGACA